jgi:hypothetical protein
MHSTNMVEHLLPFSYVKIRIKYCYKGAVFDRPIYRSDLHCLCSFLCRKSPFEPKPQMALTLSLAGFLLFTLKPWYLPNIQGQRPLRGWHDCYSLGLLYSRKHAPRGNFSWNGSKRYLSKELFSV